MDKERRGYFEMAAGIRFYPDLNPKGLHLTVF